MPPQYKATIHPSAQKELDALPESQRKRLKSVIHDVAEYREPTLHEKAKQLTGQGDKFRVRTGDLRAVCSLCKPELRVHLIGKRNSVYENVDKTLRERA